MSKRLLSQLSTFLLALGMAFLVWVAAIRGEDPIITKNFPQRIPVKIVEPSGNLFVVDKTVLPADAQVKIRAADSVWQNITASRIKVLLDLSDLTTGTHDVPLQVELLDKYAVVMDVSPAIVTVTIDPLATKILPITPVVLDSAAQGYFNRVPSANPASVTLQGTSAAVSLVDKIVADISIDGSKDTVNQEVTLIPLDANGEEVLDVTIDPPKSTITVPVDQRFGYKDVSVKADVVGQPQTGYWVSSISVEPADVTLVGGPNVLDAIGGFVETAQIDLSNVTEDVVKRVPLALPAGASLVTEEGSDTESTRSVLVTIGISALTGGRSMQVPLTVQGVRQDLNWIATPDSVGIILSGPLPILQNLSNDDITAIIDVFGLSTGVYRLKPEIIYPDGLEVTGLLPDTVEITLSSIRALTPSPTVTPSVSPTPGMTPTLILTDTISSTLSLSSTLTLTATPPLAQSPTSPVGTPESE